MEFDSNNIKLWGLLSHKIVGIFGVINVSKLIKKKTFMIDDNFFISFIYIYLYKFLISSDLSSK